jgi:hypothetical protein
MDVNLKDQNFLLVKEKGSNELHVANVDKNGKVKSTKLNESGENPDLLKIDKHGNILENFFENFMRQVKNPTRFEFFHVPTEKFNETVQTLQEAFKNPDKPENKQVLDLHRIDPEDYKKKQNQVENQVQTSEKSYAIDPDKVQWDKLEKFGVNRETLEKTGISKDGTNNLDHLLDYRKTNLVVITLKVDDETTVRTDARLSLRKQDDGSFVPAIHPIRHKPDLDNLYFGVKFTEEDKKNLLTTGNLGRVINPEYPNGKTSVLLSVDKLTNELVPFRTDWMKIPETYKGVKLNEDQQQKLGEGKAVRIENLYSTDKNKYYAADVQFNAANRCLMPLFNNEKKQSQKQENGQNEVQKTFRKKELSEDQRSSLSEGKTVKIDGLIDKKGKPYSGYINLNQETGKTDFMFPGQYKDALASGKVIPDDRHKTQVAVNSEGKTNEATKKQKEPLEKGQTNPTEKEEEKKKKGRKVS